MRRGRNVARVRSWGPHMTSPCSTHRSGLVWIVYHNGVLFLTMHYRSCKLEDYGTYCLNYVGTLLCAFREPKGAQTSKSFSTRSRALTSLSGDVLHTVANQRDWLLQCATNFFRSSTWCEFFTPPEEFIGRAGAIRLKRGDVDFLVVNVYAPVNPHLQKDKQYIVRLWAWVGHVLSLAPARCVPVLCTDANARLGRGTRVPSVGTFDAVAENFNGEQLRELLTEHHMVATNTF